MSIYIFVCDVYEKTNECESLLDNKNNKNIIGVGCWINRNYVDYM